MIDVAFTKDESVGWGAVIYLAEMVARLTGGRQIHLPSRVTKFDKISGLRGRPVGGSDTLLAILRNPFDLDKLRACEGFRRSYKNIAILIIDSFNLQWVPRALSLRDIDLVAVMRPNDVDAYERVAPGRVLLSGWGSDVLNLGSGAGDRSIDVLRVGRQPTDWDDDEISNAACAEAGLKFSGRLPMISDPVGNQIAIVQAGAKARFVVAHSNLADETTYTHPTEEYITARWVDAISGGATVAGLQPKADRSMERLLWKGATLDFDRVDLKHNVAALAEACAAWRPQDAVNNYMNALARLDWRWRIADIIARLGCDTPTALACEIGQLRAAIEELNDCNC